VKIRGSSGGLATDCRLDDRGSGVRFLAVAENFFLHRVQTDSGSHPASYPMGTGSAFAGCKTAGA
jgi:hypothetical protein